MAIRVYRLGSPRLAGEGLRVGTVRHLPRGVPKAEYAARDFFDVWLPNLAPSAELFQWLKSEPITDARWRAFAKRYRAEIQKPESKHLVTLLAALSHQPRLAVGCYCEDEPRGHRSLLRQLLVEAGAEVRGGGGT